jgi:manganese-dependent inorganic pyrophosphatase
MTTLVFGHKSPDTDSTLSAIVWAWYLTNRRNTPAEPRLLGEPNTEAAFVLRTGAFKNPRSSPMSRPART